MITMLESQKILKGISPRDEEERQSHESLKENKFHKNNRLKKMKIRKESNMFNSGKQQILMMNKGERKNNQYSNPPEKNQKKLQESASMSQ